MCSMKVRVHPRGRADALACAEFLQVAGKEARDLDHGSAILGECRHREGHG
jgi:hypothetical protein